MDSLIESWLLTIRRMPFPFRVVYLVHSNPTPGRKLVLNMLIS